MVVFVAGEELKIIDDKKMRKILNVNLKDDIKAALKAKADTFDSQSKEAEAAYTEFQEKMSAELNKLKSFISGFPVALAHRIPDEELHKCLKIIDMEYEKGDFDPSVNGDSTEPKWKPYENVSREVGSIATEVYLNVEAEIYDVCLQQSDAFIGLKHDANHVIERLDRAKYTVLLAADVKNCQENRDGTDSSSISYAHINRKISEGEKHLNRVEKSLGRHQKFSVQEKSDVIKHVAETSAEIEKVFVSLYEKSLEEPNLGGIIKNRPNDYEEINMDSERENRRVFRENAQELSKKFDVINDLAHAKHTDDRAHPSHHIYG